MPSDGDSSRRNARMDTCAARPGIALVPVMPTLPSARAYEPWSRYGFSIYEGFTYFKHDRLVWDTGLVLRAGTTRATFAHFETFRAYLSCCQYTTPKQTGPLPWTYQPRTWEQPTGSTSTVSGYPVLSVVAPKLGLQSRVTDSINP